jgi:hypothetical protein
MEWGRERYNKAKNKRNILVRKPRGKQPLVKEKRNNEEILR